MGEAKGVEQQHPRDLLRRFTNSHQHQPQKRYREESDEIELSLGLSLGGRFGVEPRETKLVRSTSISGFTTSTFFRDDDSASTQTHTHGSGSGSGSVFCSGSGSGSGPVFPLMRTSSLPMVSEEEWRKRKELQTLRRMEAKKKRSEKQQKNNVRLVRDRSSLERNGDDNNNNNGKLPPSFGLPPSGDVAVAAAGQVSGGGSHGGSSSSGVSDFDSRVVPGQGNCSEPRSPSSVQSASMSVPEPNEQKPVIALTPTDTRTAVSIKVEVESPSKKHSVAENGRRESGMQVMEEMPCVSTKGDGPNGRRIEGFLYRYKKGEEVRIVCVCHGKFLTPAEFVKHAGGGDVSHPLRHIVVSPSPSLL